MITVQSRPVEDFVIGPEDYGETDRRRAAIRRAVKMTSPKAAACFLCYALGMNQTEIGEVFGITRGGVSYHVRNFTYYLKIAYRRPG